MSASGLEQRIAQLEDIEAIKKLKANYCLHVDHANEEGWVALFTEDAVWDSDKFGRFEGREAIRAFYAPVKLSPPPADSMPPRAARTIQMSASGDLAVEWGVGAIVVQLPPGPLLVHFKFCLLYTSPSPRD